MQQSTWLPTSICVCLINSLTPFICQFWQLCGLKISWRHFERANVDVSQSLEWKQLGCTDGLDTLSANRWIRRYHKDEGAGSWMWCFYEWLIHKKAVRLHVRACVCHGIWPGLTQGCDLQWLGQCGLWVRPKWAIMLRPFLSTYKCRLMTGPRVRRGNLVGKTGSQDICGYLMGCTWVALGLCVNLAFSVPPNLIRSFCGIY